MNQVPRLIVFENAAQRTCTYNATLRLLNLILQILASIQLIDENEETKQFKKESEEQIVDSNLELTSGLKTKQLRTELDQTRCHRNLNQ